MSNPNLNKDEFGPFSEVTENLPVSRLRQIAEFDRRAKPLRSPEYLGELRSSMEKEGVREPLIVDLDTQRQRALLSEGNHRLALAEELGWSELPARVMTRSHVEEPKGAPVNVKLQPDEFGYIPADARPSQSFGWRDDES